MKAAMMTKTEMPSKVKLVFIELTKLLYGVYQLDPLRSMELSTWVTMYSPITTVTINITAASANAGRLTFAKLYHLV